MFHSACLLGAKFYSIIAYKNYSKSFPPSSCANGLLHWRVWFIALRTRLAQRNAFHARVQHSDVWKLADEHTPACSGPEKLSLSNQAVHGRVFTCTAARYVTVERPRTPIAKNYILVKWKAGGGVLLGGPAAPAPEEQFTTCARAANGREPTPLELKSEGFRSVVPLVWEIVSRLTFCVRGSRLTL